MPSYLYHPFCALSLALWAFVCAETSLARSSEGQIGLRRSPWEVHLNAFEVPEDAPQEREAFVNYAMAKLLPDVVMSSPTPSPEDTRKINSFINDSCRRYLMVLTEFPESQQPLKQLLTLRKIQRRPDLLLRDLHALLQTGNAGALVRCAYLSALADQKRFAEAEQLAAALKRDYPENPEVLATLAGYAVLTNNHEEIMQILAQAKPGTLLRSLPAIRVFLLRDALMKGDAALADDIAKELQADERFMHEEAKASLALIWRYLPDVKAWKLLADLTTGLLVENFDSLLGEEILEFASKSLEASLRCRDYETNPPKILDKLSELETPEVEIAILCSLGDLLDEYTERTLRKGKDKEIDKLLKIDIRVYEKIRLHPLPNIPFDELTRNLAKYHILSEHFERALELLGSLRKPDLVDEIHKAMCYRYFGKYEEAFQLLNHVASRAGQRVSAPFFLELAVVADAAGHPDIACQAFERVLQEDPKCDTAANYVGYTYAEKNIRLDEAESLILTALAMQPKNPAYRDSLGWLRFRQGRLDEARKLFEELLKELEAPTEEAVAVDNQDVLTEVRAHLDAVLKAIGETK